MASLITIFLLFFLPLVVFPFIPSPFEAPKVILAEILIEVLAVWKLMHASVIPASFSVFKWWPFAGLFLLSLIHIIFFKTQTSFFGNSFRLQGIFLLWHLLLFSILSANIKLDHLPKFLYPLSLLGLLMGTLILGGNEAGRAVGTLGEPNSLAATTIFIWPFSFFVIPVFFSVIPASFVIPAKAGIYTNKLLRLIPLLMAFIIIFLSGSRSGLLAFLIQIIFLALSNVTKFTIAKTVILCLILLSFSFIIPFIESGGSAATLPVNWYENRSEVWSTSLSAGQRHPIFGSGFGNVEYAIKDASKLINNNIQYQYVDSSHNFLLDYFVQGGLIGTILIISILYTTLLGLVRKKNRLLLCSFLGILTVMSFNPVSIVTLLTFWFLIGQGYNSEDYLD